MRGQTILLKKRLVVFVVLGGACHSSVAWTGHDIRKCTNAGCSSTLEPGPKHSLKFLEKGWVGSAIIASSLSLSWQYPAFADDPPILLTDTEQAHVSPVPDQLGFERSNESTNSAIDGKSLAALSAQGGGDSARSENEESSLSTKNSETTRQDSPSEGLSSDKTNVVNIGSQTEEEHQNDLLVDIETPRGVAVATADDVNSAKGSADVGSSPSLEYIDGIAKATLQVMEELNAIPSTSLPDSEDPVKHGASTEQRVGEGSTKEDDTTGEVRSTVSEASSSVAITPTETNVDGDFVGSEERKLEEEEYVHHELSKDQIEWLRKH
jgi:hypothetical protein